MNLADVITELYGLDPEMFTAARNARAKEAIAAGDRELAAAIRKLAKPTTAAWLANRLARSRASTVDELISLGPGRRRAQGHGQRTEMRRLVEKRRELIADLVKAGVGRSRRGRPLRRIVGGPSTGGDPGGGGGRRGAGRRPAGGWLLGTVSVRRASVKPLILVRGPTTELRKRGQRRAAAGRSRRRPHREPKRYGRPTPIGGPPATLSPRAKPRSRRPGPGRRRPTNGSSGPRN